MAESVRLGCRLVLLLMVLLRMGSADAVEQEKLVVYGDANFPPYEFLQGGKPRGASVDLIDAVARRMGKTPEIRLTRWKDAQEAVLGGSGHLLSMMSVTKEREQSYDFSEPTFLMTYSLFVPSERGNSLSMANLEGRRIGVTDKSIPQDFLNKNHPEAIQVLIADYTDGVRRLLRRELDAVAAGTWTMDHLLSDMQISGVGAVTPPFLQRSSAIAVPKGNAELLAAVDEALRAFETDGTLDAIIDKWSINKVYRVSEGNLAIARWLAAGMVVLLLLLGAAVWVLRRQRDRLAAEIAGREHSEAALSESRAMFKSLLESQLGLVFVADAAGQITFVNEASKSYTGVSLAELAADRWLRCLHPDDAARVAPRWAEAIAQGADYEDEFRVRGHDGVYRWFLCRCSPVREEETGRILRWVGISSNIEDIKQTQEALVASRVELLEAQRLARIGTWFWDGHTRAITASPELLSMFGWQSVPTRAEEIAAFFSPPAWQQLVDASRHCLHAGTGYVLELAARRADGSEIWVAARGERVLGADEQFGLRGTAQDITERKVAEDRVRASEEKYRTLFSNMTEAFILGEPVLDEQGKPTDVRFLEFNDAFHVQTGIPKGVQGLALRDYLPQLEDVWIDRFSAVALTGTPDRFDSYNADTQHHYEVYVFRPCPGRFAVVGRDITAQTRMETALRLSEVRFRSLYEANLVGIAIGSISGEVVEANDYYLKLIGYTREELLAGHVDWRELTPADWLPADERALAQLPATGRCAPYEKEFQLRDGSRRTVLIFAALLPGEREDVIALMLDITDRRRAEQELERLNADLERQIRERTAELVQLQKMEAIGQLTGGVAHDFNNVLQGLESCLSALKQYVPEGAPRTLYDTAKRSIESGSRLTQALLAFARRQTLVPEPIDVRQLFGNLGPLLERTLGGLIRIRFEPHADTPAVLADRGQLESALLNLAINARDAMPGGGALVFRAAPVIADGKGDTPRELTPGEYVAISVEDSGTGMDEATLARVFEPFFTTKEFGKGSGLGLSMVQGMAVQSGGSVSIASTPGQGTTLTLYLPRAAEPVPEKASPQPASQSGSGRTVLLVDDNDLVRTAVQITLERQGHRVLAANGGEAALEFLRDGERIDVLVTDYAMPGMNGAEVTRHARGLMPELPVLVITGYAEGPSEMDGVAFIQKPFETAALVSNVAALLDREPREAGLASCACRV